jgi:hypothetical protein
MALSSPLDVERIRADFPLLSRSVHGKPIVYLDSAATSQKPTAVLDAMDTYYRTINSNVHRGVYQIAEQATNELEAAREKVRAFINASSTAEVIFTKNATESLNLIVQSWGRANLAEGDIVVLSHMEHHANIVPWHMLAAERGIVMREMQFPLAHPHCLQLIGPVKVIRLLRTFRSDLTGHQRPDVLPINRVIGQLPADQVRNGRENVDGHGCLAADPAPAPPRSPSGGAAGSSTPVRTDGPRCRRCRR